MRLAATPVQYPAQYHASNIFFVFSSQKSGRGGIGHAFDCDVCEVESSFRRHSSPLRCDSSSALARGSTCRFHASIKASSSQDTLVFSPRSKRTWLAICTKHPTAKPAFLQEVLDLVTSVGGKSHPECCVKFSDPKVTLFLGRNAQNDH